MTHRTNTHRHQRPIATAAFLLATAITLALSPAPADAGHARRHHHHHHASGPPMTIVHVCDLPTGECVPASLDPGTWHARLPAADPDRYSLGVISQGNGNWVTGNYSSDPPAEIPPLVNVG